MNTAAGALTGRTERVVYKIGMVIARLGLAYLFFTQLWWKLPPTFGCANDFAFPQPAAENYYTANGSSGLCYWMGLESIYASQARPVLIADMRSAGLPTLSVDIAPLARLNGFLLDNVFIPNIQIFGWLIWLAEFWIFLSMLLGLLTRLGGLVAIGMSLQLYIGLANIPRPFEWEWSYGAIVLLSIAMFAATPGRYFGLDVWLRKRLAGASVRSKLLAKIIMILSQGKYFMHDALLIVAKQPLPGQTKTRLSPPLSHDEAADLYECFLRDSLEIMKSIPSARRIIVYLPEDAQDYFRGLAPDMQCIRQQGETLGERLDNLLCEALAGGAVKAVVMNSDSPTLPSHYLTQAFELLNSSDVVLGPTDDGGYYLIGMKKPHSYLLREVPMSTPTVLQDTLNLAEKNGVRVALLPRWYDVDTVEELSKLHLELSANVDGNGEHTRGWFLKNNWLPAPR